MTRIRPALAFLLLTAIPAAATRNTPNPGGPREQVIQIIHRIQRADYEGDRPGLQHLYGELIPFLENKDLAVSVRYWRGFALWRRAINGFNETVAANELEDDLKQARREFDTASEIDAAFADAKIGALSCVGLLAYSISRRDRDAIQDIVADALRRRQDIEASTPDNPRFLWVMGPVLWRTPPEKGGGQEKAIAAYKKGLDLIRGLHKPTSDPLTPSWGEPELLMNLAWSELNRTTPDPDAAERYALSALRLVPYWHYTRDILLPQIRAAQEATNIVRRRIMDLKEPLISEFQIEASTTRKLLERIPVAALAWKPHEKCRTLGEIAAHIANLPAFFIASLAQDELNRSAQSAIASTKAEILKIFDANAADATAVLKTLSDERMLAPWRYKIGGQLIFEMPRFVVIRTTALNHLIHHRGQLSVYLRLLNIPLPPVYGPTADEPLA